MYLLRSERFTAILYHRGHQITGTDNSKDDNRMKKTAIALAATALVLTASPSVGTAASPFDGKWAGTAPEAGECGQLVITMTITDGQISGTVAGRKGSPPILSGRVSVAGEAEISYAPSQGFKASIKFVKDTFAGRFDTFCGTREAKGSRSP